MERVFCYQCNSLGHKLIFLDEKTGCTIAKCQKCGAFYTKDRYTEIEINQLYEQSSYFTDVSSATYSDEWQTALSAEIQTIERIQGEKGSLLDVGCGGGGLVYAAHKLGWNAFGIDPSQVAVELGRKKWNLDTIVKADLTDFDSKQKFDVITAYHVLEHLYYPQQALDRIRNFLKPEGLFVIQVPNFASVDLRVDINIWNTMTHLPFHTIHFTPKSLEALLESAGFTVIERHYLAPTALISRIKNTLRPQKRESVQSIPNDIFFDDARSLVQIQPSVYQRSKYQIVKILTKFMPGSVMTYYAKTK